MNLNTNETNSFPNLFGFQQFLLKNPSNSSDAMTTTRSTHTRQPSQQHKPLNIFEKLEICFLSLIFLEHTLIFLITFYNKSKKTFIKTNVSSTNQQTHVRSIIFPQKSLLYKCLHRNWIRAYSFSNICLSFVYFLDLFLKHFHPSLVHYSSITFYSLPLILVKQIIINFHTFHLFIISISVLQYFIRYYRLCKNKYSLNIYNGRNLLITKHTNVALILSGSLALIFAYNFIFYTPKNSQTVILLPLITLNMVLLPLIDLIILIFIILCCCLNISSSNNLFKTNFLSDIHNQQQQQRLTESVRSTVEKMTCVKCYSNFLQQNRTILQDTDPYTKLHTRFFTQNFSSTRPSISPSEDLRKYSTASCENLPATHNFHARLRASYPCQASRSLLSDKAISSQHDFTSEQRLEIGQSSTNDLFLQTTLLKFKHKHSFCHRCYRLLLIFLFKYVLLTFFQHYIQMDFHLKLFFEYILKYPSKNYYQNSANEYLITISRLLFLCARFGDCFLLTSLPSLIRKYFPCWFHINSKIFRDENQFQRPSHQILVKNTDVSTNEPLTNEDGAISNDLSQQQSFSRRNTNRRYRLRFQFVPIWSKKRSTFIRRKI